MNDESLAAARRALTDCDAVVDRLHKMCCEPDRSPRMLAIKESIASVRADLETPDDDAGVIDRSISTVEDVGGQLGKLQVGCCAPARMPLYADALKHLTTVQLSISGGH